MRETMINANHWDRSELAPLFEGIGDSMVIAYLQGYMGEDCLNEDRLDHTNWYSFTQYGEQLMKRGTEEREEELLC